ncbi:MAG: hypothetical protein KatS3mg129_0093 [Leptospiraceae bacterium]|nr:MAG: hypothetical protein KatS3mg129_0093 [Leptospiraceae bacterium]
MEHKPSKILTEKERIILIQKGKEAFKNKDYKLAKECFLKANYKEGLIQLGDYYMYEKRLPLLAYGYYKKAGAIDKVEDLHRRMILALGKWIGEDKIKPESLQKFKAQAEQVDKDGMIKVQVDPKLLETAKNILKKYGTK